MIPRTASSVLCGSSGRMESSKISVTSSGNDPGSGKPRSAFSKAGSSHLPLQVIHLLLLSRSSSNMTSKTAGFLTRALTMMTYAISFGADPKPYLSNPSFRHESNLKKNSSSE